MSSSLAVRKRKVKRQTCWSQIESVLKAIALLAFLASISCIFLGILSKRSPMAAAPGVISAIAAEAKLRGSADTTSGGATTANVDVSAVSSLLAPTALPNIAPIPAVAVNVVPARSKEASLLWAPKTTGAYDVHFIHIPKCGGTSMTAILRQISCIVDPIRNADCCKNPGFCDWHAERRCTAIRGCTNHFPQRQYIFKPLPSITIFREPVSRLISAWFYRGHSPNLDFFQVRPEFKDIKDGKRPMVIFDEYLDMPEYQNIITRMLGADSFPYKNITITEVVYKRAMEALKGLFFVGLQEAYELSVKVLLRELDVKADIPILKERDQTSNAQQTKRKNAILNNATAMNKIRAHNTFDIDLYREAQKKFCRVTARHPDLFAELKKNKKIDCGDIRPKGKP